VLELRDVDAGYGAVTVLQQVTLGVPEGSVVALLGANGAGKTTLLRVASGLLRPKSGQLVVDGQDVTGVACEKLGLGGICHVGEGRSIFRTLTVRENLRLFARPGEEELLLERAVAAFPVLGRRLGQQAGTMSGGEQQMLALSRAHRSDVRMVMLDEVSMGLAPKIVDDIFEFLGALAATGVSLLLVEQYVQRALALADYVFLLNRGRTVFAGEPVELAGSDIFERYVAT